MKPGAIAIVGASETTEIGVVPGMSALGLHADAAIRAITEAGLSPSDVDGIACAKARPVDVAQYIGLTTRWHDGTNMGGCSPMCHMRHAAAALLCGLCDVALLCHGESGRSKIGQQVRELVPGSPQDQFEVPYGAWPPSLAFTTPALRFLKDRGMDSRDLANVVVTQREWAIGNERAFRSAAISVDEVLGAPMVAEPFTKYMCCPVTDAGAALVMVRAERANALTLSKPPVYLLGTGEAGETGMVSQMVDLSHFQAFRRAAGEAFAAAGVVPDDIDHLMVYDAFAHVPLYALEDLGFVGTGDSGAFIADGHTRPGGRLPLNTNGGGLNYTHSGQYGIYALVEAIRQLRNEAYKQVDRVELSFVQGVGLMFGAAGSIVLSNRVP